MSDIPPRNRAERRAAARGKGRRAAGAALTAGSAALAMTAGVLATAPAAHAAGTYTVTAATDDGTGDAGTLSAAITSANGDPGSTIDFNVGGGDISITGEMPPVTAPVTIAGPGAGALTIEGTHAHRVFYIESGADDVTISGLTLADGADDSGTDQDGASILSNASLTLSASVITGGDASGDAGGLYFDNGSAALVITDTRFSYNTAGIDGAAVAVNEASSVTITNSSFDHNQAGEAGGALYIDTSGTPTTITGTTFTANESGLDPGSGRSGGGGGAIFDDDSGSSHTLTITGSTISGNTAHVYGGGGVQLYSDVGGASVDIEDSVVSNNQAMYSGGGLYFYGISSATILRTTVSGNAASIGESGTGGGGVFVGSAFQGDINIGESTISGNSGASGGGAWFYSYSPVHVFNSTISGNTATANEGGGVTFFYVNGFYANQDTTTANHAATVGGLYFAEDTAPAAVSHAATREKKGASTSSSGKDDKGAEEHSVRTKRAHAQGGFFEAGSISTILSANDGEDVGGAASTLHSNHSLLGTNGTTVVDDQGGTIRSSTPTLGPLQNNGGPTETHALLAGSAAIDTGFMPVPSFTGNEFDQRGTGFARVVNGTVDIGAFEVQPEETPTPEPIVITPKFTG